MDRKSDDPKKDFEGRRARRKTCSKRGNRLIILIIDTCVIRQAPSLTSKLYSSDILAAKVLETVGTAECRWRSEGNALLRCCASDPTHHRFAPIDNFRPERVAASLCKRAHHDHCFVVFCAHKIFRENAAHERDEKRSKP